LYLEDVAAFASRFRGVMLVFIARGCFSFDLAVSRRTAGLGVALHREYGVGGLFSGEGTFGLF
jgi:hypothetical protein